MIERLTRVLRGLASRPGSRRGPGALYSSLVAGHGHLHGLLEVVCGDGRVAELVQAEESLAVIGLELVRVRV